jgi:hypothetical protein
MLAPVGGTPAEYVTYVRDLLGRVRRYARTDPETALSWARKAAEAMAMEVHRREVGDPGRLMLDDLLRTLTRVRAVPQHILLQWGTVQIHGNFGAHAHLEAAPIDVRVSRTCLSALEIVMGWFFVDYLKAAPEADILEATSSGASAAAVRSPALNESRPASWLVDAVKQRLASNSRPRPGGGAETTMGTITVIAEPPARPPFNPEWTILEEDTHRVLSAPPEISAERGSLRSALDAVRNDEALEVGTIAVRQRTLLAIVHDLSAEPSCRPAWIASALERAIDELRRRKARTVALPLLGTSHGSIRLDDSLRLVRDALRLPSSLERAWIVVPDEHLATAARAIGTW